MSLSVVSFFLDTEMIGNTGICKSPGVGESSLTVNLPEICSFGKMEFVLKRFIAIWYLTFVEAMQLLEGETFLNDILISTLLTFSHTFNFHPMDLRPIQVDMLVLLLT
jgi:hypothetical protein